MAHHPTKNDSGYRTFRDFDAGAPLIVELNADGITVAPVTVVTRAIGIFDGKIDVTATGDNLHNNVRLLNSGGTALVKTSGAITQAAGGTAVSVAVGGTVVTGAANQIGILVGPTAASGDIVEIMLVAQV